MCENSYPGGSAGTSLFHRLLEDPVLGARRMNVAAGKALYQTTDPAKSLYFVHRGQVRTYQIDGDEHGRLLDILGEDGWCGEAALAGDPAAPRAYGERAVVVAPSIISEVPGAALLPFLARQPELALAFVKLLAGKLSNAREEAAGLVFEDCHQRLVNTLVRFSRSAAASPHARGVVLRITHQQLAQAVGVARETVSLALTQLRRRNLLQTGRNQLTFDPGALQSFNRSGMKPGAGRGFVRV